MTSWNAANDFVASLRARSGNGWRAPSACFDPSRTGDPGTYGRTDLGLGHAGAGGAFVTPARNPIGFAPPAHDAPMAQPEPQFRTEISFKRHHAPVSPQASSRFAGHDDPLEPRPGSGDLVWPLPADVEAHGQTEAETEVHASSMGDDATETTPEAQHGPAAEEPEMPEPPLDNGAEEKVPFYKRELSFRRRKPEPELVTPPAVDDEPYEDDPVPVEPLAEEPVLEEPVADEPVLEEPVAEEPAVEEPSGDEPTLVEEPVAAAAPVADTEKSGRSFGRKRTAAGSARTSARGRGKRIVGLKIGASQIAAAVVSESGEGHELVQLARKPIDSGLVVDGEVKDADALAHVLKAFFDEHKLPKKDVRIGLASNRIGVRTFEIAGIDDETRFDNAVRFKAHEVLPVAQHESVLDYRVLEERPNEAGEPSRRILLVVAPRDQVEPFTQVAQNAGIKLAGVDLEALSLLRAFVDPKPFAVRAIDDTATVIVSIGHESTTLLVAGGGACEFTRVFDWGGGTLQDAIVQELDVHAVEAATILRHLSLSGPGRQHETLDEPARARAVEAVRMRLTPFARELVASLQFYQTQPDSLGIGEIVITGGTSHLEGLADALHQMIGVSVRVGDPLSRVRLATTLEPSIEATLGSMAVPIGLAIEDDRARSVNLLPRDVQVSSRKRPSLVALALPVAAAVPVAALGFLFVSAHGKVGDSQSRLDAIRAEISALPRPQGPEIDASLQGEQALRAQAVANVLGGRVPWDAVLRDVARVLPANVWLSSLQAQVAATSAVASAAATPATSAVPAAPSGAQIDGYTYTQPDVARLLARLQTLPSLTNVTLTSATVETKGKKSVVHFQIAADLNTGGA